MNSFIEKHPKNLTNIIDEATHYILNKDVLCLIKDYTFSKYVERLLYPFETTNQFSIPITHYELSKKEVAGHGEYDLIIPCKCYHSFELPQNLIDDLNNNHLIISRYEQFGLMDLFVLIKCAKCPSHQEFHINPHYQLKYNGNIKLRLNLGWYEFILIIY